jgi:hypothetical protein
MLAPWHATQRLGFFLRRRSELKFGPCGLNPNPPPTDE